MLPNIRRLFWVWIACFAVFSFKINADQVLQSIQVEDKAYIRTDTQLLIYSLTDGSFSKNAELPADAGPIAVSEGNIYLIRDSSLYLFDINNGTSRLFRSYPTALKAVAIVGHLLYLTSQTDLWVSNLNTGVEYDRQSFPNLTERLVVDGNNPDAFVITDDGPTQGYTLHRLALDEQRHFVREQSSKMAVNSPYYALFLAPDRTAFYGSDGRLRDFTSLEAFARAELYIDDLAWYGSEAIALAERSVYRIGTDSTLLERYRIPHDEFSTENRIARIFMWQNQLYLLGRDGLTLTAVSFSQFEPILPNEPKDPTNLAFEPAAVFANQSQEQVYLLDNSRFQLYRWDVASEKYLTSVALQREVAELVPAPAQNRLYFRYVGDPVIYQLALATGVVSAFSKEPEIPVGMGVVGEHLMVRDLGVQSGTAFARFFNADGKTVKIIQNWPVPAGSVYEPLRQRFYHIDDYQGEALHWMEFDSKQLIFGDKKTQNKQNRNHTYGQPEFSQNGAAMSVQYGHVLSAASLKLQKDLRPEAPTSFIYTTLHRWVHGQLFTLSPDTRYEETYLSHWRADLAVANAQILPGRPVALLGLPLRNKVLAVTLHLGFPQLQTIPLTLTDLDNDGVKDDTDLFPADNKEWLDLDFDDIGDNADADDDGDNVNDDQDAFPRDKKEWADTDRDGTGNNADTDDDNDNVPDDRDDLPLDPTESVDTDKDGIGNNKDTDDDNDSYPDNNDAFPLDKTEWLDTDKDGTGNNADTDDDNDKVPDSSDAFPLDPTESLDTDKDGVGNNKDSDDDNDGAADTEDAFPLDASEKSDHDKDGIGDNKDSDDDNDNRLDNADYYPRDASRWDLDARKFIPQLTGSTWTYNTVTASLGQSQMFGSQSLLPLQFSNGNRLYLLGFNGELQLHGLYLPAISVGGANFSVDLRFDRAVNLAYSGMQIEKGQVNISPTYGKKSMDYTAKVEAAGWQKVKVGAGEFDAVMVKLKLNAGAAVESATNNVFITYDATFWFVEGVGLVKVQEWSKSTELQSYQIGAPDSAKPGSNSADSAGGGSLSAAFALLWLLAGWRRLIVPTQRR